MITVFWLQDNLISAEEIPACFVYKIGEGMFLQSFLPRLALTVINFAVGLYEKSYQSFIQMAHE